VANQSTGAIKKPPLFVDLDGTLIKTDLLLESVLLLVKRNPFSLFLMVFWLLKGRTNLKHQLAQRVEISCENLPLNTEFFDYLQKQLEDGRDLILISASNEKPVRAISNHFGFFIDAIGSDKDINLKAENKLLRIIHLTPDEIFSYAGNSKADVPIWNEASDVIAVNCTIELANKNGDKSIQRFDSPGSMLAQFWKAMRPHQWLKNGLLFLPLLLSHQIDQIDLLTQTLVGFISFCLCASSVYITNDMLDLNSDRQHHSKYNRPFASGDLPLIYGFLGAPLLLLASFLTASILSREFFLILLAYYLLTTLYSFSLKQFFLIDILTLASLYTLRIVAGSAAISVITTHWLLAFSFFMFSGLALLKRFTEISNLLNQGKTIIEGRAYNTGNKKLLSAAGLVFSVAAVLVYMFYIVAPETTVLYSSPGLLWAVCPLLLYLLGRIWGMAFKGKLDEDPLIFAISDHKSQFIVLLSGVIIWLAI